MLNKINYDEGNYGKVDLGQVCISRENFFVVINVLNKF